MANDKFNVFAQNLGEGFFKAKEKFADFKEAALDFINSIPEYEMDFSGDPTQDITYAQFCELLHNYIDTHLNELSVNKYSILDLIAIHDAIDEIVMKCWNPNFAYKHLAYCQKEYPEFVNMQKITWGFWCLLFMEMYTKTHHFDDIRDIISTIIDRSLNTEATPSGITRQICMEMQNSIAVMYAKLKKEVIEIEIPEDIDVIVARIQANMEEYLRSINAINYNQINMPSNNNNYYADPSYTPDQNIVNNNSINNTYYYDQMNQARNDALNGYAPQNFSDSYLNEYERNLSYDQWSQQHYGDYNNYEYNNKTNSYDDYNNY